MNKISLIVPVYNKEKYLEKCFEGINNQIYSNLEVIFIDDGSLDNSAEILADAAKVNNNYKVIYQDNKGVSSARNAGIEASTGNFIAFVDPDDYIKPNLIYDLFNIAITTGSDIVSCCALIENSEKYIVNHFFKESGYIDKERVISQLLNNDYFNDADEFIDIGVPWGKLYRKNFLDKHKIRFNMNLTRNQDNIFNLYALHFANKIYYIDQPLYIYNIDNYSSIFNKFRPDAQKLFMDLAVETNTFIRKYYENNKLLNQLKDVRLLKYFILILNTNLFHRQNTISLKQKLEKVKRISTSPPFLKVFQQKKLRWVSKKHKIIFLLIHSKLFYSCYLLIKLNTILKGIDTNK